MRNSVFAGAALAAMIASGTLMTGGAEAAAGTFGGIRMAADSLGIIEQTVFVQLVFHVGQREFRSPDWHIQLGKNPRQCADMIFVPMCEDYCPNPLPVFEQIRNVGNHDVDNRNLSRWCIIHSLTVFGLTRPRSQS